MAKNFHSPQVVASYDQHIVKLIPGYELIHQQIAAILQHHLPESARVLVVGCGTGYELAYLNQQHPDWQLTALDLSAAMLETAQQRLAGGVTQIEWVEGDLNCLDSTAQYDAVLSILVAHFIEPSKKQDFFQSIYRHLKPKGILLNVDLTQPEQESDLAMLQQVCEQTGLTPEQSQKMRQRLQQDFHLLSPEQNIQLLHRAGFVRVTGFWQMLQYHGVMAFPV